MLNTDINSAIRAIVKEEVELVKADLMAQLEKQQAPKPLRTYTREQACQVLQCTYPTFHRLVNGGFIPITKSGRRTLVLADELDTMVKENRLHKYIRK